MPKNDASSLFSRIAGAARIGAVNGLKTTAWLLALIVPISLGVALLAWGGALQKIGTFIAPAFELFGLPESTAIAFAAGAIVNCYSGIAAFSALPLTGREVTILSFMILECHALLIESPIQSKTGTSGFAMALLRICGAIVGGLSLNLIMPADSQTTVSSSCAPAMAPLSPSLSQTLLDWSFATSKLMLKIGAIVVSLTAAQKVLEEAGVIRLLARFLSPFMKLLGLSPKAAFLWLVANTLGLAFGGGVIVEEANQGRLDRREVNAVNISIGLCHSLLEDTILFAALGANALWISFPRLALAAIAVWLYRLYWRLTDK